MIERKLKSTNTGFSDKEIKKARKKLKKAGIPKENWYIDLASGPTNSRFMYMLIPHKFETIRYYL